MKVLIAGCGYLGERIAGLLREIDCTVVGLTHSEHAAAALRQEGWDARAWDIGDSAPEIAGIDAVVHSAASGRGGAETYQRTYVQGCRNLIEAFPHRPLFFTSSTSVYSQIDGSVVTEESPAEPDRKTGKILLEAENLVLGANGTVLRLAAIYGPGRSVLLKKFLLGQAQIDVHREPPPTPDGRWINQIHRDDAASAIVRLIELRTTSSVFNVADGHPMTQRQIYTALARRFDRPLPPELPPIANRKRGWTNKRVSSTRLQSTGWSPKFPSWFDALDCDQYFVGSIISQIAQEAAQASRDPASGTGHGRLARGKES